MTSQELFKDDVSKTISSVIEATSSLQQMSTPSSADLQEDHGGSSSSITGASVKLLDGPATSVRVGHFTSKVSVEGSFGISFLASAGESGTSQS